MLRHRNVSISSGRSIRYRLYLKSFKKHMVMIECETRYSCSSTERKVQIPWPVNPALDIEEGVGCGTVCYLNS